MAFPFSSSESRRQTQAAFEVRKTGAKRNHYTVIFVETLTDGEAIRFNEILGRKPPAPPPPRRLPTIIIAMVPTS
jgi:hypothetical protein